MPPYFERRGKSTLIIFLDKFENKGFDRKEVLDEDEL